MDNRANRAVRGSTSETRPILGTQRSNCMAGVALGRPLRVSACLRYAPDSMNRKLPRYRLFGFMQLERKHILDEASQIKGLMPLLMKRRNPQKSSASDRRELQAHLKRLSRISPYIAVIVLRGGVALLPVLAWWAGSASRPARPSAQTSRPSRRSKRFECP